MSFIENILKSVVLDEAVIIDKVVLSELVIKIRIQGESIPNMAFIPGCFLRMGIGIGNDQVAMKDKIRSYSVWDINQPEGYIDVAIATRSGGIGSRWVQNCRVGDIVYYKVKKGKFLADDTADSYLMVGDLSALSHLYMLKRYIGAGKSVRSIVYSHHLTELFPDVDGSSPLDFIELDTEPTQAIISRIKEIVPTLTGKKMVYIAGDSRVCVALTNFFRKELIWEVKQIKAKPFWNPDKKGLE